MLCFDLMGLKWAVANIIEKVKNRILYRLKKVNENNLGSEIGVYAPCPSERFPEKDKKEKEIKRPKVELFACKLAFSDEDTSIEQRNIGRCQASCRLNLQKLS